jgi:hypothetical protein
VPDYFFDAPLPFLVSKLTARFRNAPDNSESVVELFAQRSDYIAIRDQGNVGYRVRGILAA